MADADDTEVPPRVTVDREWPDQRLAVTYEEARSTLDDQNATMADLDDKAMRTVRYTALLLGVFFSALKVDLFSVRPRLAGTGIALLLFSIVYGIGVYSESDLLIGPTGDYVRRLTANEFNLVGWDEHYLFRMADWIEDNAWLISVNGRILLLQQVTFVLGIAALILAMAL